MSNLKDVLAQLKSDKSTERQEGINALRTTFSRDHAVDNIDISKGHSWLIIFQSLFGAVVNEKAAFTKVSKRAKSANTGAAAQRRLCNSAAALRWLIDRSVHRLNHKTVRAILAHLMQTMVHQGEIFAPIALDYIKAIKCLVSWSPHLEHLKQDIWVKMVELAFNVTLGDPVRQSLDDEFEPNVASGAAPSTEADDSDLLLDDLEDEEEISSTNSKSKKRRRSEPLALTPRTNPGFSKSKPKPTISLEQIEMTSLLAILLCSPSASILSSEFPTLVPSVLNKLHRFLELYPGDSSLHHDYLLALAGTLRHVSLNRKHDVTSFAHSSWHGLVTLWGTKNKQMKEGLVVVLRMLFPFLTAKQDSSGVDLNSIEGVGRLWQLLDAEADSRWGVDGLSFDSIRLEVIIEPEDQRKGTAFVAQTFRAGQLFDSSQALAWVILELQADCAEKLFYASESVQYSADSKKSEGKRAKLQVENPITALLHSIQVQSTPNTRAYHIQALLFFIGRHWHAIHDSLQQDVLNTLLLFISSEDGLIQSWVFICFSAIAFAESLAASIAQRSSRERASVWESVWLHATRRVNVPTVCRAACHTAYTLLVNSKLLLTPSRVLEDIETLAKDLDVQGPAFPSDSVCLFLSQCLHVASQDVRLFRMQLEEKILSWLVDNWRIGGGQGLIFGGFGGKFQLPAHSVRDVLALLESICNFSKRGELICRILLPQSAIVETVIEEANTKVIREFLLEARLPSFRASSATEADDKELERIVSRNADASTNLTHGDAELAKPLGRERKVSTFMLKSLESILEKWESSGGPNAHPTAEQARRVLDVAVIALSFEHSLVLNGTSSNRRVVQASCRLLGLVTPLLTDSKWTTEEKALVILALEPLVSSEGDSNDPEHYEAILPPDIGSGIKTQTLNSLLQRIDDRKISTRLQLHRVIWQSADVQDIFGPLMSTLRDMLRVILGRAMSGSRSAHAMDVDDKDGFGHIRTNQQPHQEIHDAQANRCIAEVCISVIALVPILQSSSGEPTRDKELIEMVLNTDDNSFLSTERFLLVGSVFLEEVRRKTLNLSLDNLDDFLHKFDQLFEKHAYSMNEKVWLLAVQLLDSAMHIWIANRATTSEAQEAIGQLCRWLSSRLNNKQIIWWKVRDRFVLFMDKCIAHDPTQRFWQTPKEEGEDGAAFPSTIIPTLANDDDIRVRFRAAVATARLFVVARELELEPSELYAQIKTQLPERIDVYEYILTRILSLGNIMVVSSAVRRGSYWHLLETSLHSSLYTCHIEGILKGVSERMGLPKFSLLFESYASQLAYSILRAEQDFLHFPPHLLGYKDRKECAEASVRAFTPSNLLTGKADDQTAIRGKKLFSNHCKAMQRSLSDGLRECLGDIFGIQIISFINEDPEMSKESSEQLEDLLKDKVAGLGDDLPIGERLKRHADEIILAILRTLGEQDFSPQGSMAMALQQWDSSGKVSHAFRSLTRYRSADDYQTHPPNLPMFDTSTVLLALKWFISRIPDFETKPTSYHILHELFADIRKSPLINEQMRTLNALSLWAACHHSDFEEPALLQTLIQGATSLVVESDLVRGAQSILEWGFASYRKSAQKDRRFPDVLVRICCLAYDYACNHQDGKVAQVGKDLLNWIDKQAVSLCKISTLRAQVVKALTAWPLPPSAELSYIYQDITSESLSAVLSDERISSNRFRLVRRLRELTDANEDQESRFSKKDFWRLKECIPPLGKLQRDDINAFASLLVLNRGHLHSFGGEQSLLTRYRHENRKKTGKAVEAAPSPQQYITLALLGMLEGNSTQVHLAYRTLRSLMSAPGSDIPLTQFSLQERIEIDYLGAYPRDAQYHVPHRQISELQTDPLASAANTFPQWITMVSTLLSEILAATDVFFCQLTFMLKSDVGFAEDTFPVLVHTVLQNERSSGDAMHSHRSLLSSFFSKILSSANVDISCLRSIIDVVLHLRNFQPRPGEDELAYNNWLDIDFTSLAKSSIQCGAYTTALLFLELAAEHRDPSIADEADAEQILFDIYSHIDEPDGFYGIKTKNLRKFLICRFHHEKQWDRAFRFHGAALEAGSAETLEGEGLLQAFHSFGFNQLAVETLQSSSIKTGPGFFSSGINFQLGWRTETWDLPDQADGHNPGASLYLALRAIHRERDSRAVDAAVHRALLREMDRLRSLGVENFAEIREVSRNLMCLNQITQWQDNSIQSRLKSKHSDVKDWAGFSDINPDFEFSDLESIMATRISLVRSIRLRNQRDQLGELVTPFSQVLVEVEKTCLRRLSEAARDSHQMQIALNSIVRAQGLEGNFPSFEVSQEFASVLWLQNEQKLAVQFLKDILGGYEDKMEKPKKALLLASLGAWTSEACLEKPTDILTNFFDPATYLVSEMAGTSSNVSESAAVYHQTAVFAEHQYHATIKSPDVVRWRVYAERKKEEIKRRQEQITRTIPDSTEYKRLGHDQRKAQAQLQEDQESFRRVNGARDAFLAQALDMFSKCLEISDIFDDDGAIRLCSLWFANFDDGPLQEKVRVALDRVPSRKFVFLAHQLSARLSKSSTIPMPKNQENLQNLIFRMCEEHPFHSLYQVYSLRTPGSTSSRRQSSRQDISASQNDRSAAACEVFDRLRSHEVNGKRVNDVERLCSAALQWAQFPIKGNESFKKTKPRKAFVVPEHLGIRSIHDLKVPVMTAHTPLDPTMHYANCVWIKGYEKTFDTAGGINLPKINICHGSNGSKHKQLFKGGEDDLRQDAVMEQVFDLVNIVLRRDRETRRRKLSVRGYKVMPLAAQAGVLEFVINTVPVKDWLWPAHARYRPGDMKQTEVHTALVKKRAECMGRPEPLISLFLDIRKRFKPVFRHYFTERHKVPISWFAMRLNYTRSVATNSIVGHLLGLGDRHFSNILLDNVTGEVVHIDLGIAFDQGKLLPVPERVPFRMTANVVDAMGTSGTQGVFQRCAEETLRVLREGSGVIMTVLEVFKYDPLHSWTASELKVKRVQNAPSESTANDTAHYGVIGIDMTSGTAEEAADRALNSVARKLDKAMSVEYTVNELIAEATDPSNLALHFPGWAAYF